ncbi:unnamed protein product [Peniophora sp. CBMAI 1063]|nr:unnamed protein product [Peniophora sp. CBMAI 1063]
MTVWQEKKVVSVLFLDIKGAFPNAVPEVLIHDMRMRRIPKAITDFIWQLLQGRRTRLHFDDFESDWFDVENGIPQGDPLSLIMYLFNGGDLLEVSAKYPDEDAGGFVDDTYLLAIGDTIDETTQHLAEMYNCDGRAHDWARSHHLKFEASKFHLMHMTRRMIRGDDGIRRLLALVGPSLTLGGHTLNPEATQLFLGVLFNFTLRFKEQATRAAARGKSYTTQAVLIITGGLQSSPTDFLDIHANLLPMRLLIALECHRAVVCIAALPETHPLHQVACCSARRLPATFYTPLQYLFAMFPELHPDRVETIQPCRVNPGYADYPFTTHIAESREESQREDRELDTDIRVYSDGSGLDGQAGAAAVLVWFDGVRDTRRTLCYHLGPLTQHTVYEAEAIGIVLGAHLILTETVDPSRPSSISLDNQPVIRTTRQVHRAQPGHYLLDEFRELAGALRQSRDEAYSLLTQWVSGHDDLELNEYTDSEAKRAAKGESSKAAELPLMLRESPPETLLASVAALRQEYRPCLHKRWVKDWQVSPRYERLQYVAPTAPAPTLLRSTGELSHLSSSLLFQLGTGHVPLNAHLRRVGAARLPTCLACFAADEMVDHFIFDCPAYE